MSETLLLSIEEFEEARKYWLNKLSGCDSEISLFKSFNRGREDNAPSEYRQGDYPFSLSQPLAEKLTGISKGQDLTLYTLLLAVFKILLFKYTGQEDIVTGSPVYTPSDERDAFNQCIALRDLINTAMTFKELLLQVKTTIIEGYRNQHYPFEKINGLLESGGSHIRLFKAVLLLENIHNKESLNAILGTPENDLTFSLLRSGSRIQGNILYNASLFSRETIRGIQHCFEHILRQVLGQAGIKLQDIEAANEDEKLRIAGFNQTVTKFPPGQTVIDLFEKQAARTPEKTAVSCLRKDRNHGIIAQEMTYAELNGKANRLAVRLRENGITPGSLVGLVVERSTAMAAGILGILKAGAAYVPIDPEYPGKRIRKIIKTSGLSLLVTQDHLKETLESDCDRILILDEMTQAWDTPNPEQLATPDSLAYVIFTSGSTGEPKGVMVEHQSLANFIQWRIAQYCFTPADVTLQMVSIAFDGFGTNFYSSLATGGELVIPAQEDWKDFHFIKEVIREKGVTNMSLVPSLYGAILENSMPEDIQSLRFVVLAGEKTGRELVRWSQSMHPALQLINEYGPTEGTITVTAFLGMTEETLNLIGRPIANNRIYILDNGLKLLPAGVPGEICIAGTGLARGYLNHPELTAEKFTDNPFSSPDDCQRIYRTGDLGRWLPDGTIEIIGRRDQQVKIRGYRIETGEVETAILGFAGVKDAAVVCRAEADGDKVLSAYYTAGAGITAAHLKESLMQELPEYMVPAYLVQLEKMPLTSNGKIDKKALETGESYLNSKLGRRAIYEPPRDDLDIRLMKIWEPLLAAGEIGINDDFFSLGGHSLKATTLMHKIRKEFNREITLEEIFKYPTIKTQVNLIKDKTDNLYTQIESLPQAEGYPAGCYPASSAQKRLYFIHRFDGEGTAYNMPGVVMLEGILDKSRLEKVFRQLIQRHETLRTSFHTLEGELIQQIHPEVEFKIEHRQAREGDVDAIIRRWVRAFDLEQAPLLRVCLVETGPYQSILLSDMPHIISDGVSMTILVREFSRLYGGEKLPDLNLQYKDYAVWQKKRMEKGEFRQQETYWLDVFKGEIPVLDLQTDYPRPVVQSFEGDCLGFMLEDNNAAKLRTLAGRTGASIHMILLAAFNVLLMRYTGQEDIVIGTLPAGRPHGDLENVMGMFINTLCMRNYPRGKLSFKEFLKAVKHQTLKAYENQEYPFEDLLEQLEIRRDQSRNPLFDVMFGMQNANDDGEGLGNLHIRPWGMKSRYVKFDLTLNARETKSGIAFSLEYGTNLFRKETIQRMSAHFCAILKAVGNNAEILLEEIDLLSEQEKKVLLYDFNDTRADYPRDKTLPQLFEEQVARTPENIALVLGKNKLTYSELNEKADRLAGILREKGIKPGSIVGILLERSLEMIVSILGILKAGGAYLPIDPEYPEERIRYMLDDSGASLVLSAGKIEGIAFMPKSKKKEGKVFHRDILLLDNLSSVIPPDDDSGRAGTEERKQKEANPQKDQSKPQDLAYIIYTSGTTGKPKGAMIEHRNVVSLLFNGRQLFDFQESDVWTMFHSYCFDFSVWEMYGALLYGGKLVLVPRLTAKEPREYRKLLIKEKVTVLNQTPTAFYHLSEEEMKHSGRKLAIRQIIFGGEALQPILLKAWRKKYPHAQLINMYGITETTVHVTYKEITETQIEANISNIGRPIPTLQVYVLDQARQLVPQGVPGELYVGGGGVGRGYLNRPELTNERFVVNPFFSGERVYKSGDRVRFLPGGELEYLGRIDQQVKIRGHRIELGEIEADLLKYGMIKEAVVLAREDKSADKFLCAYIVSSEETGTGELRKFLSRTLPEYMIPTVFIRLEKLPLTVNGKLDRKALPSPDVNLNAGMAYEAPSTPAETRLTAIWQEVLGLEKVGVNSNFFDLGGHSLKATTLAAKIHQEMNIGILLRDIFTYPTVRALSGYLSTKEKTGASRYTAIAPAPEQEYYPLSSAQKRLYILNRLEEGSTSYNIPGGIILQGEPDFARLEEAFSRLIQRHEAFRTVFETVGGEPVQRILPAVEFRLEIRDADEAAVSRITGEFIRPFDLTKAPLLRVCLIKLAEDKYTLLYDMHHIISDGVSMGVLVNDFIRLYSGEVLEPLSIQYKDFAVWQKQMREAGVSAKQEAYWLETMKGELPVLALPTDYRRPKIQSFAGDGLGFTLRGEAVKKIKAYAVTTQTTLYMILLASYTALLYKYTGQEDIIIGSPVAGRGQVELDKIIGVFINTLAMRNYPTSRKRFAELLAEVKEQALKAYENAAYPFEELVEKLAIPRDLSRNPLFDTMFSLQNAVERSSAAIEGLAFEAGEVENKISKFDLTLSALEGEDRIEFHFEYSTSLFARATIERLSRHFLNLLAAVLENPQVKLGDIGFLGEDEEKNWLLYQFNKTKTVYPHDKTIYELFQAQVEKTPAVTAVIHNERQLSYQELDQRSNQLARVLRKQGVCPDSIVGILAHNSPEIIIGILGILKAGGAYLPIDPSYPEERIRYMLEDSNTRLMLTDDKTRKFTKKQTVILLTDALISCEDNSRLNPVNKPQDLVYIIYTSGSTGKPKGVMVTHRGLVNYIWWAAKVYLQGEKLDFPLYSSISFDLTVTSLFTPLLTGGSVRVYEGEDKALLVRKIVEDDRVGILKLTPTHLQLLEDINWPAKNLKKLIVGGEDLKTQLAAKIDAKFQTRVEIYNEYGPTETAVGCMIYRYHPERDRRDSVPIGVPADNVRIYLLDTNRIPVAMGVQGELYIGGDGVARGYFNRPELTEARFVDNPFIQGEKMYKTGDLARMLDNGTIEFLGRMDEQVKIRGYRIELGEIEAELLKYAMIKEAVVLAREDKSADKFLCAYIVSSEETGTGELRKFLSRTLPEYMIPSVFIRLEKLPLIVNGKLDRKALPSPDGNLNAGMAYEAPSNPAETRLTAIWQEVLGLEKVGVNSNFFDLGGHSLKATTLAAKIHQEMNIGIPLRDIFTYPTVRALSGYLSTKEKTGASRYTAIAPAPEQEYYPLSSAQKRLYILSRLEEGSTSYNIPGGIILQGEPDFARLEEAFIHLIQRHEAFRTVFETVGGEPVQRILPAVEFRLEIRDADEAEVSRITGEFIRPFDLTKAPLLRVCLIKLAEDKYTLLYDMHHIISDGVSMGVLVNDFIRLYSGEVLEPLSIQYKDFAVWQKQMREAGVSAKQEAYWLETMKGELPVLALPTDYRRPKIQSFAGDGLGFTLRGEAVKKIKAYAVTTQTTLYMILLASYTALLYKYTGQEDIIIGSPVAGRGQVELDKIIGVFINTLAMRNYPTSRKRFAELLAEVKEQALKAYENAAYPFEELVEKLAIPRDLSRNPLFDTMFSLQNAVERSSAAIEGLAFEAGEVENKISKFDLTLSALEGEDRIEFHFEYSTSLFARATIERLSGHFLNLLTAVLENPQVKLGNIGFLGEDEKKKQLAKPIKTDYPKDIPIQQQFEEQAARHPDRTAVISGEKKLTYRELNEKANQVAGKIRTAGLVSGNAVGIQVERSVEMIIGILGILKAGGAYLPIDPHTPAARTAYILQNSGTEFLLTKQNWDHTIAIRKKFYLDDNALYQGETGNLAAINTAEDAAYIIYTSGTTGHPKGVIIRHRNLANLIAGLHHEIYWQYQAPLHVALIAPYVFDASVQQIFAALLLGHSLIIAGEEARFGGNELLAFYQEQKIDISDGTPIHLSLLANASGTKGCGVKHFIVGGDVLPYPSVKDFYTRFKNENPLITNIYGPTECCVDNISYTIDKTRLNPNSSIPIGKPLVNTHVFILGKNLELLPEGAVGELCITGDSVGAGYINNSQVSGEKFISNPYLPQEIMYRTGDLARWLPDGNIQFQGRLDNQVKIRGYRIEPDEVAAQLLQHPAIQEAVVFAKAGINGDKILCAYFVANAEADTGELRRYLGRTLPEYMIPSAFIRLEKLPLTVNGKVDRKALPDPNRSHNAGMAGEAASTVTEIKLAEIWQEVLGWEKIGVNSNFFDLGGHSLSMVKVHAKLEEHYPGQVKLTDLFAHPSLKKLAEFLDHKTAKHLDLNTKEIHQNDFIVKNTDTEIKEIAIIGISIKLPQADTINKFWQNLRNGICSVRSFPAGRRQDAETILSHFNMKVSTFKEMAYLDEIDKFDYRFFGLSPKEASLMDPNQRLFLETAWQAVEDAGYGGKQLIGSRTGVYVGFGGPVEYKSLVERFASPYIEMAYPGNIGPIIASRISYLMDFKGPSMIVDTACSSSLAAIHLACQGIRNGECSTAIAGGIKISLMPLNADAGMGISSSDGLTRAFDDHADGTGGGEGVVAIFLKPLKQALADRDGIYAVIRGSAMNQDGSSAGITAPNPAAQADVLSRAWQNAEVDPETITYIEAHGTGTKLGDPIEVEGMTQAFERFTQKKQFCAIGSVKTNLGHLDSAAGIAGLIKAVVALRSGEIPPSLHFTKPNSKINFKDSPVYVNDRLQKWETGDKPRRCGISSFGLSGTNCHVVLEEAPKAGIPEKDAPASGNIFTLSAKSRNLLQESIKKYIDFLEAESWIDGSLRDLCYTSQTGRGHYQYRLAVVVTGLADLKDKLKKSLELGLNAMESDGLYYGEQKTQESVTGTENPDELCRQYVHGVDFNWNEFYPGEKRTRLHLPAYPFERTRCWVDVPAAEPNVSANRENMNQGMFHTVGWEYQELKDKNQSTAGTIFILKDQQGKGDKIAKRLKRAGREVIEAYTIEELESLLREGKGTAITCIIHLLSLNRPVKQFEFESAEALDKQMTNNVYRLPDLIKCLQGFNHELDLVLVTETAGEVTGREKRLYPENAAFTGLGKVIRMEAPQIRCRCIDIDEFTGIGPIVDELQAGYRDFYVAYRRDERFVQVLKEVDLNYIQRTGVKIKDGGVYIITGGTGNIGLKLAGYLSAKGRIKIVMISRSGLPARDTWKWVQESRDAHVRKKIDTILEIEKNGSSVVCYAADITKEEDLRSLLADVRKTYGSIRGIIHCAAGGVGQQGKRLADETNVSLREILAPKVHGTWLLNRLTREDPLDFFILFSSAITVMGGIGAGAYTAANAYLDAFQALGNKQGRSIQTINWPVWQEGLFSGEDNRQMFNAVTFEEGTALFGTLLTRKIPRIIVGKINRENKVYLLEKHLPFTLASELRTGLKREDEQKQLEPIKEVLLSGRKDADYSGTERTIAGILAGILGLTEIDIQADFNQLGGNSIIAIKLEADLEKAGIGLAVENIFQYPTVKEMACFAEGRSNAVKTSELTVMNAVKSEINSAATEKRVNGKILDDIQPFNDVFYKNCFYNSLFPAIRHFKKDILAFPANDIITYPYSPADGQGIQLSAGYTAVRNEADLLADMGLRLITKGHRDNLIEDIILSLSAGKPVILWLDCFFVPLRKDAFQKKHIAHTWLVYGYDQERKEFHIIEHKNVENLSYEKRTVDFAVAVNAYEGYFTHFSRDLHLPSYFEIEPVQNELLNNGSSDASLISFVSNTIQFQNEIRNGLENILKFKPDFQLIISDPIRLRENCGALLQMLNQLLNVKKVEHYRALKLLKNDADLHSAIAEIIEHWDYIRARIGNYLYTSVYKHHVFGGLAEYLDKIYQAECRFNQLLYTQKF